MVRFSNIIKPDGMAIHEMPIPEKGTSKEDLSSLYRQLFANTIDLRDRVTKNQGIEPSPVIDILRHIIAGNLIKDIYEYAASILDDFDPISQIIFFAFAHLMVGKEMGYDTNKLLKSGFSVLLRNVDMEALPNRILEKNAVLSPEDISAIRKHLGNTPDILAHLIANTPNIFQAITGDPKGPLPLQSFGIIPYEEIEDIPKIVENDVKGEGGEGPLLHVNNTKIEQEATDKMEEPDNAYKELAEIAAEKKTGSPKLLIGLIILVIIGVGALFLSGILSHDKIRKTTQVALKGHKPAIHKEKILQPIKAPKPETGPVKGTSPLPDKQTAPEVDKVPFAEKKPAQSTKEPEPVPASVKPADLSPHKTSVSPSDLSPATAISYPYSLHMESVKTLKQANNSMAELKKKGGNPYWIQVDLGEKGEWFRIFVGNFKNEDEADKFQKKHGIVADRILKTAYAVQLGMYSSREELNQKIPSLKQDGYCPYIIEQPQNRYQLLIGAYQTKKAAEELASRLKQSGQDCEVILR